MWAVVVLARVSEEVRLGLEEVAASEGVGKSELLPRMLDAYLSLNGSGRFVSDLNQVNTAPTPPKARGIRG